MIETVTEYRVLYAHTDKMGVVNNVRYFEYFEAGRNDFLRKLGCPYTELEKDNIGLPVIEAYARFKSSAKYDDVIKIRSILKQLPTVRFRIDYIIECGSIEIVDGFTVHSFVDFARMKPVRPPAFFMELIKRNFHSLSK